MVETNKPSLSIIIVVHDDAEALERNLPKFLTQQCTIPYEVIVVDNNSTDRTSDILKQMKAAYPNLYTTFLPMSVIRQRRQRLSLSIGIKAAHYSWVVVADIMRPPVTDTLFENLSQETATTDAALLMIYSGHTAHGSIRCQRWYEVDDAAALICKSGRRSGRGNRGAWKKFRRGVYDLLAVSRPSAIDILPYYDLDIRGMKLWMLRLRVIWKNLFNSPKPFESI